MAGFVISVKRTRDVYGNLLPDEKQYWVYAQNDTHSGSMSSGYPCFSFENYALSFESVEDAKKWFEKAKQYLLDNKHDWSTLAIRKKVFRVIEKIEVA